MRKLITLLFCLLFIAPCYAQVGLFIRPNSSSLTAPVNGQTWFFNSSNLTTSVWNGSSFQLTSIAKNNFIATTNPSTANDNTQGYSAGSQWYNTSNGNIYSCVNATTSAAIWVQTNNLGSLSIPLTALQQGSATTGQSVVWNGTVWAPGAPSILLNQILQSSALNGQVPIWNGSTWIAGTLSGSGAPAVTSIAATSSTNGVLAIAGSPVTTTGTFTFSWSGQPTHRVLASGAATAFTDPGTISMRSLFQRDLPAVIPQQIVSPNGILPSMPMGLSYTPGTIVEYTLTSHAPGPVCTGPDGNIYFCDPTNNAISVMNLTGSIINTFSIPNISNPANPTAICYGPDGNIYFCDSAQSSIGQMTLGGSFNMYPTTTTSTALNGIAVAADGNLWFTETDLNQWGNMTPAGVCTEFSNGFTTTTPVTVASGNNGRIWLAGGPFNQIVDVSFDNSIYFTQLGGSGAGAQLKGVAAGADGNMWFTDPDANQIIKIVADGTITAYNIPTGSANPTAICAAPDGNIYFVETDANQIGRIDPFGVITEYAITTSASGSISICVGADGALYFAEQTAAQMGVLPMTTVHRN